MKCLNRDACVSLHIKIKSDTHLLPCLRRNSLSHDPCRGEVIHKRLLNSVVVVHREWLTVDGKIREGEEVTSFEEVSVDSDNDGVDDMSYEVSKSFEVDVEDVSAPLRKVLGSIISEDDASNTCSEGEMIICAANGIISCTDADDTEYGYNDCGSRIDEISDCSADTTFAAFKAVSYTHLTLPTKRIV